MWLHLPLIMTGSESPGVQRIRKMIPVWFTPRQDCPGSSDDSGSRTDLPTHPLDPRDRRTQQAFTPHAPVPFAPGVEVPLSASSHGDRIHAASPDAEKETPPCGRHGLGKDTNPQAHRLGCRNEAVEVIKGVEQR